MQLKRGGSLRASLPLDAFCENADCKTRMIRSLALSCAAGFVLASTAGAQGPAEPDPRLTPGAIATHGTAEVCTKDADGRYTYSPAHRVWHDKRGTLAKYGIPQSQRGFYEDDDRVPLCLGGDNADPRNHWPQPWKEAELKDRLEREICIAVCDWHTMTLDQGQRIFLGDWWQAYRRLIGEP